MSSDSSLVESSSDVFRCEIGGLMPLNEMACFPFYRPRESRGYSRGKRGEIRGRRSPPASIMALHFILADVVVN